MGMDYFTDDFFSLPPNNKIANDKHNLLPTKNDAQILTSKSGRTSGVKNVFPNSSFLSKLLLLIVLVLLLLVVLPPFFIHFFGGNKISTGNRNNQTRINEDVDNADLLKQFLDFQKRFTKSYDTIEEQLKRFAIFAENIRQLEERIQTELLRGYSETVYGVTQFFDWSDEELRKLIMPFDSDFALRDEEPIPFKSIWPETETANFTRPKEFDWRTKGVVGHVKNQLKCGACWAFSSTAVIESQQAIHNGTLPILSEQQMIDCDKTNKGCEGGYRPYAFRYARDNGLLPESAYPYRGSDGNCELPPGPVDPTQRIFIDEFQTLPSDEDQIADFIVEKGPVSFGMNVTKGMFHYRGGIFTPTPEECTQSAMGAHSMEAIGFGEDPSSGTPFWILKNSWGSSYGINGGYIHVRRGADVCGIAREVHAALITRY